MVHTLHVVPDENTARLWESAPASHVTAISHAQWSEFTKLHPAAVIPHGVEPSQFTFREKPGDYACYLGRFTSGKGPLQAIEAARTLGLRLVMAGAENKYFREQIRPLLGGRALEYAGYVRGAERDQLLGGARVLLYPIQFPEAFGLVLVEAMLCGTPVAAMRVGAAPEIVDDGITGYTAGSREEFLQAAAQCVRLDRQRIRRHAERRFGAERMARDYARVYEDVVARK